MSGSNNLPVGIDASAAFAELDRQVAKLGQTFAAQAAPVGTLNTALGQTQERLGQIEQSTQRAQRAVNDLRGALELVGAGPLGGVIGSVAGQLGNLADAAATVTRVMSPGALGFSALIPVIGGVAAGVTGLVLAWQQITAQAALYGTEQERLNRILASSTSAMDAYSAAVRASDPVINDATERAEELARARRMQAFETLQAAEAANALAVAEARRIAVNLQGSIITANEDPGAYAAMGFAGVSETERAERNAFLQEQVRLNAERLAELLRQQEDIRYRFARLGDPVTGAIYGPTLPDAAPPGRGGGGGRRELDISALVERNVQRAAEEERRARERANELIARDEQRLLERRERANERTTDSIVNYAAERFADLFSETGRGFAGLMENMRRTAISTFARIAAEAVIRPIVAPIVSSLGLGGLTGGDGAGGGGFGLGGIAQALGLGSSINSLTGGGLLNGLGLSGVGSSIGGFLSAPLWGSSTAAAGMFAEASAASMGLSGSQAAGLAGVGPSLGSVLGVAGLGFAGGGLLASLTGGNQVGGGVGGALGAGAGFLLGGPVGALIGGALGGGLGGLFGNSGKGFSGGDALVGRTNEGFLTVTGFAGKRFDESALLRQTQAEVDQINAALRAANLRVTSGMQANVGGGQSRNPTTVAGALQQFGFGFGSDNARINAAVQAFGSNLEGALGVAQWITALDQLTASLDAGAQPIRQITAQFDAAFESARKYGIGLAEVTRAQNAALGGLIAPAVGGIGDFVSSLRLGADSPLSPRARAAASQAEVTQLVARARGGDLAAYGGIQSAAQNAVAALRSSFGGGRGYADGVRGLLDTLQEFASAGADQLTASLYAATERANTDQLSAGLDRLLAAINGLRADLGQAARMPPRLA
jgi:hypothetical protein